MLYCWRLFYYFSNFNANPLLHLVTNIFIIILSYIKKSHKWSCATHWNIPFHVYRPPLTSFVNPKANGGKGVGEREEEESDVLDGLPCHQRKGKK